MEYFPKTEIKHHEKSKDFNYQNWYSQIPENFKINTKDLKIENNSKSNYDTWFKKLNSKDKIKAEYSKIFKNIEITENVTKYVDDNFFKNNFNGDLKKLKKDLLDVVFGEKIENNKKVLSENQIHYFKQVIKNIIKKIESNYSFYNENNNQKNLEDIKKYINEIYSFEDDFDFKITPFSIELDLSKNDLTKRIGPHSQGIQIYFKNMYWIAYSKEYENKEDTLNHEQKHIIYNLYNNLDLNIIEDFHNILEKKDFDKNNYDIIFKRVTNKIFEICQNEYISYISTKSLQEIDIWNLYEYWFYKIYREIQESKSNMGEDNYGKVMEYFGEKFIDSGIKQKIDETIKKYIFICEKLFLKYKAENKSMHEFEAIIRNVTPQKYKRLCMFLEINPECFDAIYEQENNTNS